jgi:two-component system cell cycle sensor histidine kinase/response regulator CckA
MSAIVQLRPKDAEFPDPALLMAAVEALPESLAIIASPSDGESSSGVIVYANPAWCGMFQCSDPSLLQNRPLEELIAPHAGAVPSAVRLSDEIKISSEAHFVHTRRDGTCLHLELAKAGFHLQGGEFQVVRTRDVGWQKQVERQLHEAQTLEAIGRLVGGVAHDFNNLLTGIMLYCDLLIGELEKDSRPQRHVQEMRLAGEHGAALVQQLLAVARPHDEETRVFVLNDVVRGIEDLLTRLIGENIVLNTSLAADLGRVRMDPAQIQQILLNLVLNARDAMPGGGEIKLSTRNCADCFNSEAQASEESRLQIASWVELSVTDTGSGMDSETLERAFEPFFTTKKPGRGNGLGLATARRLVRQEGGSIIAQSEPDKGTQIIVRLPRVPAETALNSKVEVTS